ncbi:hypothetical protein ECC02_010312 [Trypanosoma cruzi]|uniref:RNase H n=1 Tax=Trypanosoma cruzi TaxID=5693 RepID=A0A7J6XQS8_TRYCR|nr:hypothetical protein ECC02_010312 [Trypanosoma cruzi]
MPPSMHGTAATSIPLPRDAVINGLQSVCVITGIPRNHLRAPPLTQRRIIPWDTVSCNEVRFYQPLLAKDASEDVKRTAFDSLYSSLGDYDFELWADGSSSLAELASGSAALLYDTTKRNDLPVEVHRAAAGRLACSYGAECPAVGNGIRHLIPPRLETFQSPTRILVATDSLSAIEALRVAPMAMRSRITEEIWIMLLSLIKRGRSVEFIFFPSDCGIPRTEAADEETTIARSLPQ